MYRTAMFYAMAAVASVAAQTTALADPLDPSDIPTVTEGIISLCRGGTLSGSNELYSLDASAGVQTVIFKKLAEAGAEAEAKLKNEEWEGIQSLADANQFHKCVEYALPIFLSSMEALGGSQPLAVIDDTRDEKNKVFFKPGFEPKFTNAYLASRLIGFEVVDDNLNIVVGVTNINKIPIRIQLDQDRATSVIGMRGGLCSDTYKAMKVRGIRAHYNCCQHLTRIDPQKEIVFSISNLPCEQPITAQSVNFSFPYRILEDIDHGLDDEASIVFIDVAAKNE
ncbi:hypothetical protein [Consotaella aegiceratis]|uniref:hypothetical protein n=1 Tax=Consotaella aegiceratis TaxID=3097961 RepID=UPI002F429770